MRRTGALGHHRDSALGPNVRARFIAERLEQVVHHRSIRDASVLVTAEPNSSELRVQGRLVMVVTEADARTAAQRYAPEVVRGTQRQARHLA